MNAFFSAMFSEMGQRRRRLREMLGDRGQGLAEFLVFAGVLSGSLGLFLAPWMPAAAPWGFAAPFVFLAGYGLIDWRRQVALAGGADPEKTASRFDWAALLWSFACALVGAAAFVLALSARPPASDENWAPPASTVDIELHP